MNSPFNWISEKDTGIYDAMNKGIALSIGKWLLFLGDDDKLYSKEIIMRVFNQPIDNYTKLIIGKIKFDWKDNDSYFVKKNDGIITPSWSKKIWIRNTLPHQGVFYKKSVFENGSYDIKYSILADYDFNLRLFKAKMQIKTINEIISICGTNGISKNYNWELYKEEIKLKTEASSMLIKPFFIFNAGIKYLIKKMNF